MTFTEYHGGRRSVKDAPPAKALGKQILQVANASEPATNSISGTRSFLWRRSVIGHGNRRRIGAAGLISIYTYTSLCIMKPCDRLSGWDRAATISGPFRRLCAATSGRRCLPRRQGETDPAAKPLRSFGRGSVLEVVARHDGGTWRAVYTMRFDDAVYVLNAFQKKSRRGRATPKQEMELVRQRLREAERMHRERLN